MLVSILRDKTITDIKNDNDDLTIVCSDGKEYSYYHSQDCCEHVRQIKIIGEIQDILDCPITLAEDDNPSDPEWYKEGYYDSHTWSVLILESEHGRVEFWYLGESNGYYGESMSFEEIL